MLCILPPGKSGKSFNVIVVDYAAGLKLASGSNVVPPRNFNYVHDSGAAWTYKEHSDNLSKAELKYTNGLKKALQKVKQAIMKPVADMGGQVKPFPGLYLPVGQLLKSYPCSITNIHPTTATIVIANGTKNDKIDPFILDWKKRFAGLGLKLTFEYSTTWELAWNMGGEVHCATNAFRIPKPWKK